MDNEMTLEEYHEMNRTGKLPERLRKKTRMEVIADVAERDASLVDQAAQAAQAAPRRNKYNAVPTEVDGITFPSKKEARRYTELRLLEQSGEIFDLELQPKYVFIHNDVRIGRYTGDFRYKRPDGSLVVEDVKSPGSKKARDYGLRVKMMKAFYGITVEET